MASLKKTKSKIVKLLYQLMHDVDRLFEIHDISYWAIGGTALGAVRHKGIIPWDDDLDISIDVHDVKKLTKMKNELKKCGLCLAKVWLGYKIYYLNRPLTDGYNFSFPNLDIFTTKYSRCKIVFASDEARKQWSKDYYKVENLFPLHRYKFGQIYVWGARDYIPIFKRVFGPKWNSEAYREYDHEFEEVVKKVKVCLTAKDRVPAKPLKVVKRRCIPVRKK